MNKTAATMEHLKRHGYIRWRKIMDMGVKNPPDVIYRLRAKGHAIGTVMKTDANGNRYAEGYTWHSGREQSE